MILKKIITPLFIFTFLFACVGLAQIREYRIHNRGMLHNTVFNTGEIGRGWMTGEAGNVTTVPLFEWPPYSKTFIGKLEYSGQHNLLGAGVYVAANSVNSPGKANREFSFCGGVGASSPEVSFGRWSFPLYMEEIENYPVLSDGTLNPDYNPDEAEEIIKTSWASSVGITFTRTSRAWSYPDYDDMIIYEYELEYTGDTDGNPETIEREEELRDVMILFNYGFAPSMYGYQRHYNEWKYEAGIYRGDQRNHWDADYWLSFNLDVQTALDPLLAGKPEPDIEMFKRNALTGEKGGGLCSPQAPGYAFLYYDTTHLAIVDPFDPSRNESEAVTVLRTSVGVYYELDDNFNIKQPWSNKVSTGNTRSSKMQEESINPDKRWSGVYSDGSTTWPEVPNNDTIWYGRAAYNYRQCNDGGMKHLVFGPYTLNKGDKLYFSYAEVVGYGAEPNKRVEGGDVGQQWNKTQDWNKKVVINGITLTEHYLDDYGYPDYVNSEVKNVTQVAHKSFTAYLGHEPTVPVWPESNPRHGSYKIPVPFPAPGLNIVNTPEAEVQISWNREVENFQHPRLMDPTLSKYRIYRSNFAMGPWELLKEVNYGDVNNLGEYEFLDIDQNFKIGETKYYSVTSVDASGNESGKTNLEQVKKQIGPSLNMNNVHVVPNPFNVKSGFEGAGEEGKIRFYGLTSPCTIRIFSYSGQLVIEQEHTELSNDEAYEQITLNDQEIASGLYFYVVTSPSGEKATGKFVVIK